MADPRPQTRPRVLLIGLDGATFDVIDPLIAAGRLPHIASLIARGTRSALLSTIPIASWSAWPALMSGKHPGKHGVYHYHQRDGYRERVISSGDVRAEMVWETLGRHGRRVAVIGVPVTYPPRRVNGVMVAGPPMPPGLHTHPAELAPALSLAVSGYPGVCLGVDWRAVHRLRGAGGLARHVERCFDLSLRATLHVLRREEWDFLACVFCELDRAQHLAPWPREANGAGAPARRALMARCYEKADQVVGELAAAAGAGATIALVSDHGFGENRRTFHLNRWLADQGLLALNCETNRRLRVVRRTLDQALGAIGFEVGGLLGGLPVWVPRWERRRPLELLDWGRTRASGATADLEGIYINLRGREPQGIVEPGAEYEEMRAAVIAMLQQVRDPDTGEPIVAWARRREEVFHGPYLDRAPDVIYMTRDNSYPESGRLDISGAIGADAAGRVGGHRREGIMVLAGPGIKRGQRLEQAQIVDVTPTLLRVLGLPIADDLDGEVLTAALEEDDPARRACASQPLPDPSAGEGEGLEYSAREQQAIEEQLRRRGYL